MANMRGEVDLESIETKLGEILKNPENFYKPQLENASSIKQLSQKSYSFAVCDELFRGRSKAVSKLLIEGFDEEQIWQQSDLLNRAASSNLTDFVYNFDSKDLLPVFSANSFPQSFLSKREKASLNNQKGKPIDENSAVFSNQESSAGEDYVFDDDSDSAAEFDSKPKGNQFSTEKSEDESDDSNLQTDLNTKRKKDQLPEKKRQCASEVDGDSDSSLEFDTQLKKIRLAEKKSEYESDDSNSQTDLNTKRKKDQLPEKKRQRASEVDGDSDSSIEFDTQLKKIHLVQKESEYESDDSNLQADFNTKCKKDKLPHKKRKRASDVDGDSDSSIEFNTQMTKRHLPQKSSKYASIVDDQFFKLSQLENFLRIEDLKEERGDEPVSDDDIDLFQDIPSDLDDSGEDEESEDKTITSARNYRYEDFFDDPESELENENNCVLNDKDESLRRENDEHSFDENESDVEMETGGKDNQQNKMPGNSISNIEDRKTKFELEQEKINKKIQEYEESMLQPISWHLTGEVAADKRPVNSLIEQETEFDCNTRQEILADKDVQEKHEEITIMAIRNKAYTDPERKYKPTQDVINYKKEVALEQTKSKKSLAEVYEEDYLKKQNKQDAEEEEDPKHKEIKKLMGSLLPQLHALFSHIPKPAIPEIKIVSNLPAITVEEVAPTNVSDATLLAPEEVKKKTGIIKGKTERTDTDRKHERRKKKIHQRLKEKKKLQKLESQKENPSAKISKLEKLQALKKVKQHKNTKIATVDEGGKLKSSKDFFSRLQDTMDTKNKAKFSGKKVKNK